VSPVDSLYTAYNLISLLYNFRIYLPNNVISILLKCLPTLSGKYLMVPRLERVILNIVNFILRNFIFKRDLSRVAFFILSLVVFLNSVLLYVGIYIVVTALLFFYNCLIEL